MKQLKKPLMALALAMSLLVGYSAPAVADYTFVVPQKPGSGTSVWTAIVAKELEKHLGEKNQDH